MQTSLDLSFIIVNWNSAEFVCRCVRSICQNTTGLSYEIIVIDNASFDGCDRMLHQSFPDVRYFQSHENLGFARANNLAFQAARGNSVLFLNPDTEIVGNAIMSLFGALSELPGAGVVGAKLLNADGTLQTSCLQSFPTIINQTLCFDFLRRLWPTLKLWGMAPLFEEGNHAPSNAVQGISGACMLIRREVFEQIGRFSEEYFMYTEDLDLCYKAIKSGRKNYYVPKATIIHFGGGSSKQAATDFSYIMLRESIWRFLVKTHGNWYGLGYRTAMLFAAIIRLGLLLVLFPIQVIRGRQERWWVSFREWRAVLLWGLDRVTRIKGMEKSLPSAHDELPAANT